MNLLYNSPNQIEWTRSGIRPAKVILQQYAIWIFYIIHQTKLNELAPVSDLPRRCRLRSSSAFQLLVPSYRLSTIGRRSFPVAASTVWNFFLVHVQSLSILAFRQRLQHSSFISRFTDIRELSGIFFNSPGIVGEEIFVMEKCLKTVHY